MIVGTWIFLAFMLGYVVGRALLSRKIRREIANIQNDFDNWSAMTDEELAAVGKRLDKALARLAREEEDRVT